MCLAVIQDVPPKQRIRWSPTPARRIGWRSTHPVGSAWRKLSVVTVAIENVIVTDSTRMQIGRSVVSIPADQCSPGARIPALETALWIVFGSTSAYCFLV